MAGSTFRCLLCGRPATAVMVSMQRAVATASAGICRNPSYYRTTAVSTTLVCSSSTSTRTPEQQRRVRRRFCSNNVVVSNQQSVSDDSEDEEAQSSNKMMLILGKPGGGKGTISGKLLQDFPRFHHISTGDLLRQHVREQTRLGRMAKKYMDKGELVPDQLMIELVLDYDQAHNKKLQNQNQSSKLLLDGFPRSLQQAVALDDNELVDSNGSSSPIDAVINLDIPTEIIVERIADRWIHPGSGRIYSYSYRPPKKDGYDDLTGEPLIQREDDKPAMVRTRLQKYDEVTLPLIEYYENKGILKTFQGTMSDVIYPQVKAWLKEKDY